MNDLITRIRAAGGWSEYYEAYKALYSDVLRWRWALGKVTFANQLHHPAIPDASGSAIGTIRWAAYSQPSRETLVAFASVFAELLGREPHRFRTNRYIVLVPEGPALDRVEFGEPLGDAAGRLDYWCGGLDEALQWPAATAVLESVNVMLQTGEPLIVVGDAIRIDRSDDPVNELASLRRQLVASGLAAASVVPPALRHAFVDSSFVLAAFRRRLSPSDVVTICQQNAGVAAWVARSRATSSAWPATAVQFCDDILSISPARTRTHIVAPGETLARLVREYYEQPFETLWPMIQAINPEIRDPNFIRAGQAIEFPVMD
jgi:hypothetical protein